MHTNNYTYIYIYIYIYTHICDIYIHCYDRAKERDKGMFHAKHPVL